MIRFGWIKGARQGGSDGPAPRARRHRVQVGAAALAVTAPPPDDDNGDGGGGSGASAMDPRPDRFLLRRDVNVTLPPPVEPTTTLVEGPYLRARTTLPIPQVYQGGGGGYDLPHPEPDRVGHPDLAHLHQFGKSFLHSIFRHRRTHHPRPLPGPRLAGGVGHPPGKAGALVRRSERHLHSRGGGGEFLRGGRLEPAGVRAGDTLTARYSRHSPAAIPPGPPAPVKCPLWIKSPGCFGASPRHHHPWR